MTKYPFSKTINTFIREKKLQAQHRNEGWIFSSIRTRMYLYEFDEWKKHYLPFNVAGKTIMCVGAGEGETALFYFNHGATKIICVEPDQEPLINLCLNAQNRCMPIYQEFFSLSLIDKVKQEHKVIDLIQVDIEGYEEELLRYKGEIPVLCEVHGLQLLDKFKLAGWKTFYPPRYNCLGFARWKC